jgi:hypothetical protein
MSVISATQKERIGGSLDKASLGKVNMRSSLKTKLKAKELRVWLRW